MIKTAATLEYDDSAGASASPAPLAPRGSMKFAFASGSRPLDGYTLKRGIGRGGFGEVYFAVSDAGKEVAVKRIERNLDIELRGVVQCLNLRHGNLVELYDIKYDEQDGPWVVMEYIAGASLKDILDANPRGLPDDEVHAWFRGIAAGVTYLHDHGIVHRDLKPANIFDDAGTVKIGDYGLSKYISCSRRSGNTESVGTCHYMAPEIGRGDYGKEIDVYALGVMLFELLTGTVPFDGESSQEVLMKHLTTDPDLSRLPEKFRPLVARAMRKDPQHRYATVESFLAEFEMAVTGECLGSDPKVTEEGAFEPVIVGEPIVSPVAVTSAGTPTKVRGNEPIYIGDPGPDENPGIELGPVKPGPGRLLRLRSSAHQAARPLTARTSARPASPASPLPTQRESVARQAAPVSLQRWLHQGWGGTVLKSFIAGTILVTLGLALYLNPRLTPLAAVGGAAIAVIVAVRQSRKSSTIHDAKSTDTLPLAGGYVDQEHMQRWALRMLTPWDRIAELAGSYLTAALVTAVLCLVMSALTGKLDSGPTVLAFQAWMIISSTAGAWLLLAAGKFWEVDQGEPWKRRFVLLMLGLVCGSLSWFLDQALLVSLTDELQLGSLFGGMLPAALHTANGSPTLALYLLYFGVTFALVPWWKYTDPTRSSRLSVGAVMAVALASLIFPFPQPWGLTIAVASAVAAQLSANWLSPDERLEIERRYKYSQS